MIIFVSGVQDAVVILKIVGAEITATLFECFQGRKSEQQ